jgi:hypothetical protein
MMGGGFGFGKKQDDFAFTGTQRLSAWPKKLKTVPATIQKPDYAEKVPPFSPSHCAEDGLLPLQNLMPMSFA